MIIQPDNGRLETYLPLLDNFNDCSGYGFHGTNYNVLLKSGSNYKCGLFNGSSSYIILNNSSAVNLGNINFSLCIWFFAFTTSGSPELISKSDVTWSYPGKQFFINANGKLQYDVFNQGSVACSTLIQNNRWYHATITYDLNTRLYNIYLNGKLDGRMVLSNTADNAGFCLKLGRRGLGEGLYWNGYWRDFRYYKRTLTEEEAQRLYNRIQLTNRNRFLNSIAASKIKKANGLLFASLKKENGLAEASIKKADGLNNV